MSAVDDQPLSPSDSERLERLIQSVNATPKRRKWQDLTDREQFDVLRLIPLRPLDTLDSYAARLEQALAIFDGPCAACRGAATVSSS